MPKPDVFVYLDEFEKGNTFVLSATFIPVDIASLVLTDWNNLRRKIKSVLLAEYPNAATHKDLQDDLLPEIHAVDLFQSHGYYRKYRHGTDSKEEYWLQHYDWLKEALLIVQKYNIRFVAGSYAPEGLDEPMQALGDLFDGIVTTVARDLIGRHTVQYSRKKLNSLVANKYLYSLPNILVSTEDYLRTNNLYGEIICDDHDMSKGFSIIESFDWLKRNGHYKHLTKPRFTSGLDDSLLQVCDVLCYVAGRYLYSVNNNTPLMEPLKLWSHTVVAEAWIDNYGSYGRSNRMGEALISLDLVTEMCVSDLLVKNEIKRLAREAYFGNNERS